MIAVIDISRLLYIICCTKRLEDEPQILKNELDIWIEDILIDTNATSYLIFGDKGSFRRDLLPEYKSNRTAEKPKYLDELRDYCIQKWGCVVHPKLEADDLVIIHHNYYDNGNIEACTICTGDSDLQQYPAYFYNPTSKKFKFVCLEDAVLNLWVTVLAGGHNGLKGLRGCGIKTAERYLKKYGVTSEIVERAYIDGIIKEKGIKGILGLGLDLGVKEFYDNFISAYLLRTLKDCEAHNIDTSNIIQTPRQWR